MKWSKVGVLACVLVTGCDKGSPTRDASSGSPPSTSTSTSPDKSAGSAAAANTSNADGKLIEKPGPNLEPVPPDLPVPPGMNVLTSTKLAKSEKVSRVIYGQIPEQNDVSKAIEFFTAELPKQGWQVKPREGAIIPGSKTLEFNKQSAAGTVSAYQKDGSAGTFVMVQTEESLK